MKKFYLTFVFLISISINAQVINNTGNRNQTYPKVNGINPDFMALAEQVSIINLESNIRWMQEIGIRNATTPVALTVQNWLVEMFESYGLEVYTHHFNYNGTALAAGNVIAIQYGTEFPDQYIVISSHYDHPSGPGADDNASGTAGVLEIARILSQQTFKRSILYIPFNAEELWMVGSLPYVELCAEEDMNVLACFNLDMIGYFPVTISDLRMYSGSSFISDRLFEYYKEVANMYIPDIPTSRLSAGDSYGGDHMPFNMYEYPALYIGDIEYDNPCYHRPCDTIGHGVNNMQLAQAFVKATLVATTELADGWLAPQNFSAIAGNGKVTLNWEQAPETSYCKIYKNDMFLTETDTNSFIDTEVTNGTKYVYHVTGIHFETGLESAFSNTDSVIPSPPLALPYFNDFETNFDEWHVSVGWDRVVLSGNYTLSSPTMSTDNCLSIAELQWFSIPQTTENITLSFYLGANIIGIWKNANGFVEVTTDRKSWHKLDKFNNINNLAFKQISLNDYIGADFFQIRFRMESSGDPSFPGNKRMWLDNVKIELTLDKLPPENVTVTRINDEARLKWDAILSDGYNVYRDGVKVTDTPIQTTEYTDIVTPQDEYCYQVTALYPSGESNLSEMACLDPVGMQNIVLSQISISPVPTTGNIDIFTGLSQPYQVSIYNLDGIRLFACASFVDGQLDMSHIDAGVYILTISTAKHCVAKRIVVQ